MGFRFFDIGDDQIQGLARRDACFGQGLMHRQRHSTQTGSAVELIGKPGGTVLGLRLSQTESAHPPAQTGRREHFEFFCCAQLAQAPASCRRTRCSPT